MDCNQVNCESYKHSVSCIKTILKGLSDDVIINFFDDLDNPLNLDNIQQIHCVVFDSMRTIKGHFWWPTIPNGEYGYLMTSLQEVVSGYDSDMGVISLTLNSNFTNIPSKLFIESIITIDSNTKKGITAIQIAEVLKSAINEKQDA